MRAVLPRVEVAAPEHINFNMCAAQDSVQLTFEIRNVRWGGEIDEFVRLHSCLHHIVMMNITSDNGLLCDGTKLLPESVLDYHQWHIHQFWIIIN